MEKYHVTVHITNAITSGCDCKNLDEIKDFIEEELFQAKQKGKDCIMISIKEN